jgi:exopolysaccharide biosynthesis polyprenyl glycosylphosphotransferase
VTDVGVELPSARALVGIPMQMRRSDVVEGLSEPPSEVVEPAGQAPLSVADPADVPSVELVDEASSRWFEGRTLLVSDLAAGAVVAALDLRLGLATAVLMVVATSLAGLRRRRFSLSVLDEAPRLLRALSWVVGPAVTVGILTGMSAGAAILVAVLLTAGLFGSRTLAYRYIRQARRDDRVTYAAVVIGDGAEEVARRIGEHPETGLRLIGTADHTGLASFGGDEASLKLPVDEVMDRFGVSDLIVTSDAASGETAELIRKLSRRDLAVHLVIPQVGATPSRGWDDHIWGLPLLRMQSSLRWRRTRHLKRATDVLMAGMAILVLFPLLALTAFLVRREVGPGVIFRQERIGLDGRIFEVLKFRSMRSLPPGEISPWTVKSEDRIGPVGRFIRKYSIDELPQLWNILRGDMSVVGPRPERPEFVSEFTASIPHYGARHRAPVGLTGLAAVEGLRGDTSIQDRAYFDNLYVDSWNYWNDIKIIARTVLSVAHGTGS